MVADLGGTFGICKPFAAGAGVICQVAGFGAGGFLLRHKRKAVGVTGVKLGYGFNDDLSTYCAGAGLLALGGFGGLYNHYVP